MSIRPGPWWLKPLWSLRQQVEVSRTLSEATGARHAQPARLLQPLGVLDRHRRGDHRERLVGGEQAVAAGEQVALQPALAVVLGEDLHHPPVGADVLVLGAGVHQAAVLDLEHGAEPVGVGLVGAEEAEVRAARRWRSRRRAAARRAAGWIPRARRPARSTRSRRRRVREVERHQPAAAVGVRGRAHPLLAARAPARPARGRARPRRRSAPRAGSCASTPRASPGARGSRARARAAPGGRGRCPRPARRRPPSGPVQPFGVRSTIAGQRGRAGLAADRARASWIARIARVALVERDGEVAVDVARVGAGDEVALVAVAREQRGDLLVGRPAEHGRAGDLVLVQVQDRQHGAVAGRVEEPRRPSRSPPAAPSRPRRRRSRRRRAGRGCRRRRRRRGPARSRARRPRGSSPGWAR